MPSLDYIEKLTGIKEEWIQNSKETESALVLAVQLPPQEHICPHCKAATRRIKGYYTRLIKHSPLLHKELHLLYRQRRYICSCGHTFNEKNPFASPYFQTSSSLQQVMLQELRQHLSFQAKKWPDAMSAPARSFASLMKSIFLVPVTFPACFPSMNLKEMLRVRSTRSSSLTLQTSG